MDREYVDLLGQPVTSTFLSHDQKCILAGCLDSTIRLLERWEVFDVNILMILLTFECVLSKLFMIMVWEAFNISAIDFLKRIRSVQAHIKKYLPFWRSTGDLLQEYKGHTCKVNFFYSKINWPRIVDHYYYYYCKLSLHVYIGKIYYKNAS